MYASFDRHCSPVKLDSVIKSLSWKGNAKHGWLALGNSANTVGITYTEVDEDVELSPTETQPELTLERQGMRRSFNFREHSHEVTLVRWNPLLDKIATCDSSGTVIVWRNHNGRSIMELVNNRGNQISDFQWSHDGTKVLISYVDGYVLMGTAFGRRIWARQLNIGSFVTTPSSHAQPSRLLSSTWSPDDSRIVVGSSIGELIELDAFHNGSLVSTTEVLPGIGIIGLQWVRIPGNDLSHRAKPLSATGILEGEEEKQNVRLSLYLRNGKVVLMNSCGDQQATIIRTGLIDGRMLWSTDGSVLAVAGLRKSQSISTVRFFQPSGQLLFTLSLETKEPVTVITWGHDNHKLFIATNNLLHTISIQRAIPSLQDLCQMTISSSLKERDACFDLVLPTRLKFAIAERFTSLIKGHIPRGNSLLEYVSHPPPPSHRVYCTLIPSTNANSVQRSRHPNHYTLYIEHLGTLVPILEASKRNSKIRPCFTISLPSSITSSDILPPTPRSQPEATPPDNNNDIGDSSTSAPFRYDNSPPEAHNSINTELGVQLACKDEESDVPRPPPSTVSSDGTHSQNESSRYLAEVSSHIIASKFRIQSLNPRLPSDMGVINIKTSFLHIQPRKVIVNLPVWESDSGIDSDSGSEESDELDNCLESELSLDSLSSMEELRDSKMSRQCEPLKTHRISSGCNQVSNGCVSGSNTPPSESQVTIHSKTPTWNEQHMIYQLDFGGRVTTKSAKNFQLEMGTEQVLQFGRIENGSFILDFQAPFSPIQAFATALANLV